MEVPMMVPMVVVVAATTVVVVVEEPDELLEALKMSRRDLPLQILRPLMLAVREQLKVSSNFLANH
jgi:hypothetical protein